MSSGLRPMQNGLKFEMFQTDFDVCVNFRCVGLCRHKMAINLYICIEQAHTYWRTVTMQNIMWGSHLLSRFFWLVKCPKSSTKHILNANKIILTLRAGQRSNSIVYQHRDRSLKSNQVKLLEYEMPGFCQNDTLSPCLDVAAACIRVSGHIWSIWRCSNTAFFKRYFLRPKGTKRTAWNAGFWSFGICIPLCIKRGGRILLDIKWYRSISSSCLFSCWILHKRWSPPEACDSSTSIQYHYLSMIKHMTLI